MLWNGMSVCFRGDRIWGWRLAFLLMDGFESKAGRFR